MQHQLGYSLCLCIIIVAFYISWQHVVPVISRALGDAWHVDFVGSGGVGGDVGHEFLGIFPERHNLRHGCGYTSCHRTVVAVVFRTHHVVWIALVPLYLAQQRCYLCRRALGRGGHGAVLVEQTQCGGVSSLDGFDHSFVAIEKHGHTLGHLVFVVGSAVGIAHDFGHTVIARHDGETLVGAVGKYVVVDYLLEVAVNAIDGSGLGSCLAVYHYAESGSLVLGNLLRLYE